MHNTSTPQYPNCCLKGKVILPEIKKPPQLMLDLTNVNRVSNRINSVRSSDVESNLQEDIVEDLKTMLDENNILVQSFRMAKEKLTESVDKNVSLKLIGKRGPEVRTYNLPEVSEVAALIVGDFDEARGDRDIIIETRSGVLKRINELHPSYLG
ncbi:hypothetical protein CASFOL_039061 [Castilleja foliolosa]|uniref:Uncharacterized protein n=1 Tax=Castilleja foliolosa TaxID=1961234 RepID=A0ABD3BIR4_9LAMI